MQRWKACVAAAMWLAWAGGNAVRAQAPPPVAESERLMLWPGELAPGEHARPGSERIVERSADPTRPDRYMDRIARPHLVVHRPARPDGSALLVIPGGGYMRVVLDKEGTALVPAFAGAGGVTLFVLRYRLPGEGHAQAAQVSLADAQRALRLIRAHASDYAIDPARVGVMGFSAGGHLAAMLATQHARAVYAAVDAADTLSARPDLQLLVYPVIAMQGQAAHAGSRRQLLGEAPSEAAVRAASPQAWVQAQSPPAFLLHAQDDAAVPVANSLLYAQALLQAGVSTELHVFPRGGHGFGVRGAEGLTAAAWPQLALDWMRWQYAQRAKPQTENTP